MHTFTHVQGHFYTVPAQVTPGQALVKKQNSERSEKFCIKRKDVLRGAIERK